MTNYEDMLESAVSWLNNWAMTGNFMPLLDMFHRTGRICIDGAYGVHRADTREEMEDFLRENKPGESMTITHSVETPIGASATFRWNRQTEDADAGNVSIEVLDGKILRLIWEFMPVTRHPIALAQHAAARKPAAPAAPAPAARPANPFRPMTAGLGMATSPAPANPAAPATPTPAARVAPPAPAARVAPSSPAAPAPAAPAPTAAPTPPAPQPQGPTKPVFL